MYLFTHKEYVIPKIKFSKVFDNLQNFVKLKNDRLGLKVNRSEILEILKKYKNENGKKYGINTIGLFGSFSRDEGNESSDVDIIIEISEPDIFKIVHIKADLEELLLRTVDIVRDREKMNPYLKKYIKRDAVYV